MIVSNTKWKENNQLISKESCNYILIDTQILSHKEDLDRFKLNIGILEFITLVNHANDFYMKEGIKKSFDTTILYKAIQVINETAEFTDSDFREYMTLLKDVDLFFANLKSLTNLYDQAVLGSEIELLLLGITSGQLKQNRENRKTNCECFQDMYCRLSVKHLIGKITFDEFFQKTQILIASAFGTHGRKLKCKAA